MLKEQYVPSGAMTVSTAMLMNQSTPNQALGKIKVYSPVFLHLKEHKREIFF